MAKPEATARRRVTAADVAAAAGVSRATVGFVLNATPGQTISEGTRERVLDAAERLGYRPNSAARALASGRSRIILLVLPDWPVEFRFHDFLDEASLALDDSGYSLVTHVRHPHGRARPLWESLSPDMVVGLDPFSPDEVAAMRECGVARILPEPARPSPLGVTSAASAGPHLQIEHLRERGHRHLAYVVRETPRFHSLMDGRYEAARTHADSLGLPPLGLRRIGYGDGSADQAVQEWHASGISGIAAFNDDVAATVVGAAIRAGIRVPEELAVIGHDDSPIAAIMVPALTTILFDTAALGRGFAEFVLHRIDGRISESSDLSSHVLLVHREST